MTLGQKLKFQKKLSKFIVEMIWSCFVQKTAPQNTKYSRNETIFKIGHHAKTIPMENPHFKSKIKIAENMSKSIVQII